MRETVPDRRALTEPPDRCRDLTIAVVFAVNGAGLGVWAAFLPSPRRAPAPPLSPAACRWS